MEADEKRLIDAALKAEIAYMGCDTPDWLAETIVELRAELSATQRELDRARGRKET